MSPDSDRRPGVVREFLSGIGLLGQGLRTWATAPRLMGLGIVPAIMVGAAALIGLIVLGVNLQALTTWVTPFAGDWGEPWRTGTRILAGVALVGIALLLVITTFTTVTLIVGAPFYERVWRHVEEQAGDVPSGPQLGFWRTVRRGIGDGIRMLLPTVGVAVLLLPLGFIPLLGQVLVALLAAVFGAWFVTVELTGMAFDARGYSLRERRAQLRARRAMTLGFGVGVYLLFLVPLGAVLVMPGAVAGATLLTRRVVDEPTAAGATPPLNAGAQQ